MKKIGVVLMSVFFLAGLTQASVLTLSPIADSYIRGSQTGSNFGTATFMVSNNATTNGIRWSFVRFDLSSIHEPVVGVKLEIQADKAGNTWPTELPFDVYGLTTGEGWIESGTGGLTWNNAPARSGNAVDMAGVYGGAALSTFNYKGVVSGNSGGPVVAAIDQVAGGAAVNFFNADSDKIVTFIIARKYGDASNGSGAAWATKERTYTDVAKPRLTVYTGAAVNPAPANGQGLATDPASPLFAPVAVSQNMSWQAVSDSNLDPAYTRQYRVYMDPNQTRVSTGTGCQYFCDFNAGTSYDPPSDLACETTYYWRVDSKIKWGYKPDPNTIIGNIWNFKTISSLPTILTEPANTKVKATETAAFTVTYQSVSTVPGVTWFKNGGALPADADYTVTWNQTTSTLTIANMEAADAGSYYCDISNSAGTTSSATAMLAEKKLLAWYQFENNLNDSAGTNHGTLVGPTGGLAYVTDMPGTISGQAYSADPNGGVYSLLSTDAYPKTGFGNGLEEGTISVWFKAGTAENGYILGSYNDGTKTSLHIGIGTDGQTGKVHVNVRDEDTSPSSFTGDKTINDNQWHYITLTLTAAGATLYTDVTDAKSTSGIMDNYAAWQYPVVVMARNVRGVIGGNFSGMLDDLKIFNYAWTQQDAAQEYYNVTGRISCIYPQAVGEFDLNSDCKVDVDDFIRFAEIWLQNGFYPVQ